MPTQRGGYYTKDGLKRPSVTTILGRYKESSGLIQWAYGRGREHGRKEALGQEAPTHLYDEVGKSADVGTLVHAMAEDYVNQRDPWERWRKESPELPEDGGEKARRAFQAFLDWFGMTRLEIVYTEVPMVSEKLMCGGTMDWIARTQNGELVMGDTKTSNAVYADHIVQVAAYRLLWNETHPDEPLIDAAHVCQFNKEFGDFAHHHYSGLANEEEYFRLLRMAYARDLEIQRRAR